MSRYNWAKGLPKDDEPVRNAGSAHLDELLETTLSNLRASLADQLTRDPARHVNDVMKVAGYTPVSKSWWELDTAKPVNTKSLARRRRRLVWWLRSHRPVVHFGPCNHEDCW